MSKLSAYVLTFNEEGKIRDALEGVSDLCFLVEGEDVSRKLRHGLPELEARAPAPG